MRVVLLLVLLSLTGCQSYSAKQIDPSVHSDRSYYYQQSVVHPNGFVPDFTPYGTPTNLGTATDYDRPVRPDAISDYSFLAR